MKLLLLAILIGFPLTKVLYDWQASRAAKADALNVVRSSLYAPEYATFRDVTVRKDSLLTYVCGTVVARRLGQSDARAEYFIAHGTFVLFERDYDYTAFAEWRRERCRT